MKSKYIGTELDIFRSAQNWKNYWASHIRKYIAGVVLEAGGGIGANVPYIASGHAGSIVVLEPDPELCLRAHVEVPASVGGVPVCIRHGFVGSLGDNERFDTILYIDVVEHIEDDRAELGRAADRLAAGGHLIVLVPAYNWLYSEFDRAIGHHRRYTRGSLSMLTPPGCTLVRLRYLDSVGVLASVLNKLILRQSTPRASQIAFWDNVLVPASKILDPLVWFGFGKTVLAVWRKLPE